MIEDDGCRRRDHRFTADDADYGHLSLRVVPQMLSDRIPPGQKRCANLSSMMATGCALQGALKSC
jgi:hypothetical protein